MVTHDPAIADHAVRQITVRDGQIENDTAVTPDGAFDDGRQRNIS